MNYKFFLPCGYEKRDILALNKVAIRKKPLLRIAVLILRIVLIAFGLFLLIAGLALLFGNYEEKTTGAVCVFVGFVWSYLGVFYYRYLAWRSRRNAIKNAGGLTIELTEESICELNALSEANFLYDAIREIVYYRETYFLFVDKRHALILPVRAFLDKTDSFEAFVSEKCDTIVKKTVKYR